MPKSNLPRLSSNIAVAGTDGNWRGVEDVSQDALALYALGAGGVTVELEYARLRRLRLSSSRLIFCLSEDVLGPSPSTCSPRPASSSLQWSTMKSQWPIVHQSLKSVLEGSAPNMYELKPMRAVGFAVVRPVRILAGRENNVTSGEDEDPIAPTAFATIGTARSF